MSEISLVLWDWNGTLLNDVQLSLDCLNRLLRRHGYPQRYDRRQYRRIFQFPIEEYYRKAGFDFARHPFSLLAKEYMRDYLPASFDCTLAPGAKTTLAALGRAGKRQVMLSASQLPTLHRQTAHYGVEGFFDELLGLSDIYAKSKVELGLAWMRQTGIPPESAVMVGDSVHDAEVARAMGVRCLLYSGGHQAPALLRATGCTVVSQLGQLPALLKE